MTEAPTPHPLPHENETFKNCTIFQPKINSFGVWENQASLSQIFTYSIPLLEIQILLVLSITHLIYTILKPLGITFFASQMMAGMILGPAMLGKIEGFYDKVFNQELGLDTIDNAAFFGFGIFLFLMGVKMDLKMAFRTTRRATVIGVSSFLSPFVVGLIVFEAYKLPHQSTGLKTEHLLGITIESLTGFSVIAWLLSELKILNSEIGRLALSSSSISTLTSIVLIYVISISEYWSIVSPSFVVLHAGQMVFFVLFIFLVLRPLMIRIIKETPEGRPIKDVHIALVMIFYLGCCVFTAYHNDSALYGAFIFGLAVPDGPPLGSALVEKFECFVNGVFLPLFVTTSTMRVKPNMMFEDPSTLTFYVVFSVSTFLAKFISCSVASFWRMMPLKESLAFSLIMCSKGIVELSYFSTFRDNKIFSDATFSMLVIGVLVNATIIPVLVKLLYDPVSRKVAASEKRSLMQLKPDSELRILASIHGPEHVLALIDVLDITCPTKDSPNVVYALHLIELVGRDSPVFIDHNENQSTGSFENIIAFNRYEKNNRGLVKVNTFTSISPHKLMHEDICSLALDKQTSFVFLPFHRKWSLDGSVEVENNVIRNLNCNVLDRPPCSVGILVDRRSKPLKSSSYSIGMLFLGGKDDREALTLAKRMARDPRVKLTVIRISSGRGYDSLLDWDTMLDAEILKDIKQNDVINGHNITYIEQVSKHGPQTANIIRSLVGDYDLIIVGRRYGVDSLQTTGLSEWSEFPELGVMGDILSSTDLDCRAIVLVVQQHYVDVYKH
ncbi:cation/H+ exchanger 4 [Hibiscus trionum]|uniref:Cation/H+ exchanger 4 n=1 Tax=Hibiscus trionum TaxID=183268 RepID=A0A9W7MEC0_HIBTR|nr:cation/H+ exchanger 4 [Hibiscus trionum]